MVEQPYNNSQAWHYKVQHKRMSLSNACFPLFPKSSFIFRSCFNYDLNVKL